MPEKIKDKIFQPFFTIKPTGSGTGLGLSLSNDIVKAHGGEIKVESKENEGTKFIISIACCLNHRFYMIIGFHEKANPCQSVMLTIAERLIYVTVCKIPK
ncbi:MAG: hypothetical protein JSU03_10365 [Bacteroidetes bacterium]|nr:hypothetical protein [Bacteroidota bacterium]MBS1757672.1 hypothetical protein [Bacteroidota bacterium]